MSYETPQAALADQVQAFGLFCHLRMVHGAPSVEERRELRALLRAMRAQVRRFPYLSDHDRAVLLDLLFDTLLELGGAQQSYGRAQVEPDKAEVGAAVASRKSFTSNRELDQRVQERWGSHKTREGR